MSLYTRLIGGNENEIKLPVHQFMAAMSEHKRGKLTPAQVIAAFNLNAAEQTQVLDLINRFNAPTDQLTREQFHDICMLAEYGIAYGTEAALKARLGVP